VVAPRRWRDYRTRAGRRPVRAFIADLPDEDAAAVVAAMKDVATVGLSAARHLRGEIYEVRADGLRASYRLLFSVEGRRGQVLLALEAFSKKSQKTPDRVIGLAERRLRDWRSRAKVSRY
jgi:phage-related protein